MTLMNPPGIDVRAGNSDSGWFLLTRHCDTLLGGLNCSSVLRDQKCSSDPVAENTVRPMMYSMNRATPCRYTMNSLRVSAATAKNSEPVKKICTTTMEKKGCKYHSRMFGPMRA